MSLCDDNNACTEDYCDTKTKTCAHNNTCVDDLCNVANCNVATGCFMTPITCIPPDKDPECYVTKCDPKEGCISKFIRDARKKNGDRCMLYY